MIPVVLAFVLGIGADAALTLAAVRMIAGRQDEIAREAVEGFEAEIVKAVPALLAQALKDMGSCSPSE